MAWSGKNPIEMKGHSKNGQKGTRRVLTAFEITAAVLILPAAITSGLAGSAVLALEPPFDSATPNVVLVVADDVGFSDLGAYGSEIRTPTIDGLASQGVLFSNFHASPMCSPSRAMLLTGVDSHTAGVASLFEATPIRHRGKPGYEGVLRSDVVTLATRLRDAGYRTYLSGKWNLGHGATSLPSARGFDRTFALDATGADNFEKRSYLPLYEEPPWFADGEPTDLPEDFYSSEFLVDKMIEFVATDRREPESSQKPFFAYLAFQAIHIPVQAPAEFIDRYEGVYDRGWKALRESRHRGAVEKGIFPASAAPSDTPTQADWDGLPREKKELLAKSMAVNAGMLEAMDHHLGRFIDYLKRNGLFQQTVFLVLSDNGPEAADPTTSRSFVRWLEQVGYRRDVETLGEKGSYAFIGPDFARAAAAPLAYYKFHGGEGGVRVPLIVAGAGVEATGLSSTFSFITDVAPTVLALAGVSDGTPDGKQPMIGRSLMPVLKDRAARVHPNGEAVPFETAGHAGVFKDDYKLVRVGATAGDGRWRLFDLTADPGETRDLAGEQPARFAEMMADYEAYSERVGVLEVPRFYSPTRQLGLNYLYDRARANTGRIALLAFIGIVLLLLARRVLVRRSLARR